jgi:hypothetical protein
MIFAAAAVAGVKKPRCSSSMKNWACCSSA